MEITHSYSDFIGVTINFVVLYLNNCSYTILNYHSDERIKDPIAENKEKDISQGFPTKQVEASSH
jgi:hypothetical protein